MIEIIPNWHPIFVHFTIGLLFTASILFIVSSVLPESSTRHDHLQLVAFWNLWIGYAIALVTACFGWLAYNSVAHDAPSHEAMTLHRNSALLTLAVFLPVVTWSLFCYRRSRKTSWAFIMVLLVPTLLLARTGWLGGEAVYRYGLGVMSLPKAENEGHSHSHSDTLEHGNPAQPEEEGDHTAGTHHDYHH